MCTVLNEHDYEGVIKPIVECYMHVRLVLARNHKSFVNKDEQASSDSFLLCKIR